METIKSELADSSKLDSKLKYIEDCFKQKLLYHSADAWCDQLQFALMDSENIQNLEPMLHYEKYYREIYKEVETFPEVIDKIIELSDKEQIKKYDTLVDKFNSDLERIKKESDSSKIKYFFDIFTKTIEENKINN